MFWDSHLLNHLVMVWFCGTISLENQSCQKCSEIEEINQSATQMELLIEGESRTVESEWI